MSWQTFVHDICVDPAVADHLQRSMGFACMQIDQMQQSAFVQPSAYTWEILTQFGEEFVGVFV